MYLAGIDLERFEHQGRPGGREHVLVCKSSRQTDVERGFSKVTADMADMVSQLAQHRVLRFHR